ncbi:MAG: HAMP domain-containing protein [Eubacteriales bacterium]|nr:HAMP domain-containing protein [Eubacteriales bacterium]
MRKSLKKKWTAFMMLLVLAVLAIVGVFLLSATVNYYINQFRSQVGAVFTTDLITELDNCTNGSEETAVAQLSNTISAYSGALGIGSGREYYILDAESGECLTTSEVAFDGSLNLSPNMITAMNGAVGEKISMFSTRMDVAVPITNTAGETAYVIAVRDDRSDMRHMCWLMFMVIVAALIIGLVASAALSMVLIRTVTDPIAALSRGAKRVAEGDFTQELTVQDPDELGELTQSFNEMAQVLHRTQTIARLESARMRLLSDYLKEGTMTFSAEGELYTMNTAAENLLGREFVPGLHFADVFPGLPFPDAASGAVQLRFTANGYPLHVIFVTDENHGFDVVVVPAEEGT